ncbi:site-2 protease family protein [Candidatus Kaiserbacteria bacterium]|nr:site-2 protease family protein [Candidatus Kaiserbacteria bacterium]
MQIDIVFGIVVLIFSIVLHEVAHGYMADWLGDPTARLQGRLTLNPINHIDPIGSLLLPGILLLTHAPILIGYAKPVPYNPYNLRGRHAEGLVAFAGPGTNILLAVIFGLLIRFGASQLGPDLINAFAIIAYINLLLAFFNLIPVPPLDGSKVLSTLFGLISPALERGYDTFRLNFERLGILSGTLLILVLFYYLSPYFSSALFAILSLLTGLPL